MSDLDQLIDDFREETENLMELLKSGRIDAVQWEREFADLIAMYNQAALMLGLDSATLAFAEFLYISAIVDTQLAYLSNFALVVQSRPDFIDGWVHRAELYAQAIKTPYWKGAVNMLPLPAMPAQGTLCQTNCKCAWRIETVNEEQGDYDCYWERAADDSCDTCLEREAQWQPIRVRNGMLI